MDINVSAATGISTSLNCDYTDESNVARTMILPAVALAGNFLSGGLIITTGPFASAAVEIRVKAGSNVILYTAAGTFTGVTYAAGGVMQKLA
jgi:hypothetical protein